VTLRRWGVVGPFFQGISLIQLEVAEPQASSNSLKGQGGAGSTSARGVLRPKRLCLEANSTCEPPVVDAWTDLTLNRGAAPEKSLTITIEPN
jgi:hypothetical protein